MLQCNMSSILHSIQRLEYNLDKTPSTFPLTVLVVKTSVLHPLLFIQLSNKSSLRIITEFFLCSAVASCACLRTFFLNSVN